MNEAQIDRGVGVLVGAACGDALGAGYEFGSARVDGHPEMIGGGLGGFAPGEWTDDTAQTYAIAEVAATGADLRSEAALDAIAQRFADWYADNPPDVGIHTNRVLGAVGRHPTAAEMRAASDAVHARGLQTGGNGTLMRTSPVALAHLDSPESLVEAAMKVAALTHYDPVGGEACALWCLAIRHAVLIGEMPSLLDLVEALPSDRHDFWRGVVTAAERQEPATFNPNGYVVTALQAAWSAISHLPGEGQLVAGLESAIAIGNDTDTVASIAGALLGGRWGYSAIPSEWRELVHGWPGGTVDQLRELAIRAVTG